MRALRTLLATLAVLAALPAAAHAAAFTVNDTADGHDTNVGDGACAGPHETCTLRAAVEEIDEQGDASNSIALPAGTFKLPLGSLSIQENVTITGQSAAATIIDGSTMDSGGPIFDGNAEKALGLEKLTVTGAGNGVLGGFLEGFSLVNGAITGNAGNPVIDLDPEGPTTVLVDHSSITKNTGTTMDIRGFGSTVTMTDSVFSNNDRGQSESRPVLIDVNPFGDAKLTIERTTMEHNTILSEGFSDGIIDFDPSGNQVKSTIRIADSTFRSNLTGVHGQGVLQIDPSANDAGPVDAIVARSVFEGNVAGNQGVGFGGAIGFYPSEDGATPSPTSLTLSDSTFTDNVAGGGDGGYGGAVDWSQPRGSLAKLTVTGSTFSGNQAGNGDNNQPSGGGAIAFEGGALDVANSTFTGNAANGSFVNDGGGAVMVFEQSSTATFTNVTMVANQATGAARGGGVLDGFGFFDRSAAGRHTGSRAAAAPSGETPVVFTDSIVAGNRAEPPIQAVRASAAATTVAEDCFGPVGSGGHNIESADTCGFDQAGDRQKTDPKVAALASNGGPTQTMAIGKDSPAFDTGDDATCKTTDQRGVTRPQFAHCDIGAFELAAPKPVPTPQSQTPPPQGAVQGVTVHKCVSRRHFRIRLRVPRGAKVASAKVFLRGHRVSVHRGPRLTAIVNLRRLPKGRFTVKIVLHLTDGRTISGVRRYHTCHKAIPPKRVPKV